MSEETPTCNICRQPLGADGRCPHCDEENGHVWTIWDWRPLLTLSLILALGFSLTSLVVTDYKDEQNELARKYYAAGVRALEAKRPAEAVKALETALVYSRDDFGYRLKLTEALLAAGNTSEALGQLRTFREQRPGDARVNLQLARVEAQRNHVDDAVRYYLNAIQGEWGEGVDPIPQRIAVRFESAEYLVKLGRREQAQGALIALSAVLPSSSTEHGRLADLFLRNGDATRALAAYQEQLRVNRQDQDAIVGAAHASYATGNYSVARRYLQEIKPETTESKQLLTQLDRMEALDPFSDVASPTTRRDRTVAAFQIAIDRLATCGVPFAQAMKTGHSDAIVAKDPAEWSGLAKWAGQLAPWMTERKLRGRDDVIESTMRFVFQSEIAAQKTCGAPWRDDEALLLLARERMGMSR